MRKNFINIWGNYVSRAIPGNLFYPCPTGRINDSVLCVCDRNDSNFFIFSDGTDTIAVDAGYRNNNYVKEDFAQLGVDSRSISHVFLTHTDMDHAGAFDVDSDSDWMGSVELYLGRKEEPSIRKEEFRRLFFYNPIEIRRDYHLLDDGAVISVGDISVKAVLTPGHTRGHLSYLVNDSVLFVGDLLLLEKGRVKPFYSLWNNAGNQVEPSIRKLAKMKDISIMLTSHSKYTTDYKTAMSDWV